MKMESTDGNYKNNDIRHEEMAKAFAFFSGLTGFKLYNDLGHFIAEYALFDGKYREVKHD